MIENVIGKRFAEALSDSITEEARLKSALENLGEIGRAFQTDPQLSGFFLNPSIPQENKEALAGELCEKLGVEKEVGKLINMLVQRKKMIYLENIRQYFEEAVDRRLNQARVHVTSAFPMSDSNIENLKSSLSRVLEKNILIDSKVDESLLGGMKLNVGGLVADSTIKNSLALLKKAIENEEVISEFTSG